MSEGQTVILTNEYRRQQAHRLIELVPNGAVLSIKPARRTNDQNALMWAMLSEISRARPEGRELTPDVWKMVMMHACGHAVQFEIGLNGQPFPMGFRSSRLSKAQMTDLIEFIMCFAAEKGVKIDKGDIAA